jgi:hypothetical protein
MWEQEERTHAAFKMASMFSDSRTLRLMTAFSDFISLSLSIVSTRLCVFCHRHWTRQNNIISILMTIWVILLTSNADSPFKGEAKHLRK